MTLSNSYDFSLAAIDVFKEALENVGAIGVGDDVDSNHLDSLTRAFNIQLKSKQVRSLQLWTWKDAVVFLESGATSYELGPTGDHATESYVQTTLAADAALGASTLGLTSTTGMTSGDSIGIVLDDGTLFWTTVSAVGGTDISSGLTSAAASGNVVFAYTAKIQRPLSIKDVRLFHINETERPCNVIPISEYNGYPNKTVSSEIVSIAHEPLLDNTRLSVWPANTLATDVLKFSYKKPVDDIDGIEDSIYAPVDCYDAIVADFTARIAGRFGRSAADQQDMERKAEKAFAMIHDFEDDTSISFAPGRWQ
jgi:hypothetical protein